MEAVNHAKTKKQSQSPGWVCLLYIASRLIAFQ